MAAGLRNLADSGMEIRRLTGLDPGQLSRLVRYGRESLGDAAPDEWMLPVIAAFGYLFVGRIDGTIAGSAQVFRCRQEGDLYMDAFYIRPDRRRRGMGRAMLEGVMEHLSREGYHRLLVTAAPGNREATALYETAGFGEVEVLEDFYGAGRQRLLLAAPLTGGGGR